MLEPEDERDERDEQPADPENDERGERVDVVDEPAEVLPSACSTDAAVRLRAGRRIDESVAGARLG